MVGVVVVAGCAGEGPTTRAAERVASRRADPPPAVDATAATDAAASTDAPVVAATVEPVTTDSVAVARHPASTEVLDACTVAEEVVRGTAAARSLQTAGEQLDAVGAVLDDVRPRLDALDVANRLLVEQLVAFFDEVTAWGAEARAAAAATGDAEVVVLTDQLVVQFHAVVLNPLGLATVLPDADECPGVGELAAAADAPFVDPWIAIRQTRADLVARGHGAIADGYLPPGLAELTDRDMTVALSGRQDDYDRCWLDVQAAAYGDNRGCDALHDACDARDLLACNDLYWSSVPGSEYEEFGATCGGRAELLDPAGAGFCERLG